MQVNPFGDDKAYVSQEFNDCRWGFSWKVQGLTVLRRT